MSMFTELYHLALNATLAMTVSADKKQGKLTINVIPKPKSDTGEAALSTPLTLTATPEEFDAEFVTALTGFRVAHTSLSQQALVTRELLDAAKEASAKKGAGAVAVAVAKVAKSKPAAPTKSTPVSHVSHDCDAVGDVGDGDDGDISEADAHHDGDNDGASKTTRAKPAATTAAPDREPQLFG